MPVLLVFKIVVIVLLPETLFNVLDVKLVITLMEKIPFKHVLLVLLPIVLPVPVMLFVLFVKPLII